MNIGDRGANPLYPMGGDSPVVPEDEVPNQVEEIQVQAAVRSLSFRNICGISLVLGSSVIWKIADTGTKVANTVLKLMLGGFIIRQIFPSLQNTLFFVNFKTVLLSLAIYAGLGTTAIVFRDYVLPKMTLNFEEDLRAGCDWALNWVNQPPADGQKPLKENIKKQITLAIIPAVLMSIETAKIVGTKNNIAMEQACILLKGYNNTPLNERSKELYEEYIRQLVIIRHNIEYAPCMRQLRDTIPLYV